MQEEIMTNTMKMSVHITKFLKVFIQQYIFQGARARYDQINLLTDRSCELWFYIQMNKILCPHVNVLPPEADDLLRIYEAPKNARTQIMQNAL